MGISVPMAGRNLEQTASSGIARPVQAMTQEREEEGEGCYTCDSVERQAPEAVVWPDWCNALQKTRGCETAKPAIEKMSMHARRHMIVLRARVCHTCDSEDSHA